MTLANTSLVQTGLPQTPDGVPHELYNQFFQLYNAIHNLERFLSQFAGVDELPNSDWSQTFMDTTLISGNLNRLYVPQFEAVTFGQVVSPFLDAGILKIRKANATDNTKFAFGVVSSTDHVSGVGAFCEVTIGMGLLKGIGGLIVASRYFLSTTSALVTNVAPVAAGNIEQVVGVALAGNRLFMSLGATWIQH